MRLFSRVQVAIRSVEPSAIKADVAVFDARTVKAPAGLDGGAVNRLEQHVIHRRGSIAV